MSEHLDSRPYSNMRTAFSVATPLSLQYQHPIPVEQLVQSLCDTKQGYTRFGGFRLVGVSFLFAGYDSDYGFQLNMNDQRYYYAYQPPV